MNNIKEDFINDYMVLLLSETEMCEKYKMCRATLYKTKKILGLKRIKTTKVNRILGSAFTDKNNTINPIKKEVSKPVKEHKLPIKPEVIPEDPTIKPIFHNQVPEPNVEIIQKPDKSTKTNDKSALLQALQLSSNTLNKLNSKKNTKKNI